MSLKQHTPSERRRMLASLKMKLKQILEEGQQIKNKRDEISTISRFNIFKRAKLKFTVGNGLAEVSKALYAWENEYQLYKECLTLGPMSVFLPYIKLIAGTLSIIINVILTIDLLINQNSRSIEPAHIHSNKSAYSQLFVQ